MCIILILRSVFKFIVPEVKTKFITEESSIPSLQVQQKEE